MCSVGSVLLAAVAFFLVANRVVACKSQVPMEASAAAVLHATHTKLLKKRLTNGVGSHRLCVINVTAPKGGVATHTCDTEQGCSGGNTVLIIALLPWPCYFLKSLWVLRRCRGHESVSLQN